METAIYFVENQLLRLQSRANSSMLSRQPIINGQCFGDFRDITGYNQSYPISSAAHLSGSEQHFRSFPHLLKTNGSL